MKRIVILLMLVIMALSVISCDKSEGDRGVPTFIEVFLDPYEDFFLVLEYEKEPYRDDTNAYCSLVTKKKLEELWINTDRVDPDGISYSSILGYYMYDFDLDYLDGALPSAFNEEIVYQLKLEGKTVNGSLVMPAEYNLNPPSFDPAQDYELVWTLAEDPQAQNIWLPLEDTNDNYYDYGFELKPSERTYTINKSLWSDYQPTEEFDLGLEASNYQRTKGGVVWFISSYRFEEYGWKTISPHQLRIEKLLRGENLLPK